MIALVLTFILACWFSRNHGFTWYAVEDPERYVALSKASLNERARGLRKDG